MERHCRRTRVGVRAILDSCAASALAGFVLCGCANIGRLAGNPAPVAPTKTHTAGANQSPIAPRVPGTPPPPSRPRRGSVTPLFGDTLIGLIPGTADTSRRYLGRLRGGFTADTLNLVLFGDNRPGYRSSRLAPEFQTFKLTFTRFPTRLLPGLASIPVMLWRGLYPDLGLIRDIPGVIRHTTNYGRERQVITAILSKVDSLQAHGQTVAAVVNSGDLVKDGRRPRHWTRFLRITRPLSTRVPYFASPGNHDRTDTPEGLANWGVATGLPISNDRLYYCLDTADGWLRFIALDSNPIVDPGALYTREAQIQFSKEEFAWAVDRIREHEGPVIVLMHHPPFSAGFHRNEWQRDSVLIQRRETMVRALHDAGLGILVTGHEHTYQRALLTWPDAVLIAIVSGGAGAPLHFLPSREECARLFSEYHVAGSVVKPENVYTAQAFNFVLARLWFGGGEFQAYAVDAKGKPTQIDRVAIDLTRYGTPQIDQHKVVIPAAKGPRGGGREDRPPGRSILPFSSKPDSTAASKRLLSTPPPGNTPPPKPHR